MSDLSYSKSNTIQKSNYNNIVSSSNQTSVLEVGANGNLSRIKQVEYYLNQAVAKHKEEQTEAAIDLYLKSLELEKSLSDWVYANTIILLAQSNRVTQALDLKEQALKIHKNSDKIYRAIGLLFNKQENFNNSIDYYLKSIEINQNQPDWLYSSLIEMLVADNQLQRALEVGRLGTRYHPDSAWINHHLGEAFTASEQWEKAVSYYNKAVEIQPDSDDICRAIGLAFNKQGDFKNSIDYYSKSLDINQNQPDWLYSSLIEMLVDINQLQRAVEVGEMGIRYHPDSAWINYHLGKAFFALEKWEKAVSCYIKAEDINPDLDGIYREIGLVFNHQKDFKSCIDYYLKSLEINQNQPDWLYSSLIETLAASDQLQKAVELGKLGIRYHPDSAWINYHLGQVFFALEKWEKAVSCYTIAQKTRLPEIEHILDEKVNCAKNRIDQLNRQKAFETYMNRIKLDPYDIGSYQKALEIQPKNVELYLRLTSVLVNQERIEEGIEYYKKAIDIQPSLTAIYPSIEEITKDSTKWEAIIKNIPCEVSSSSSMLTPFYQLTETLTKQNRWDRIIEIYQETLKFQPNNPTLLAGLADAFARQNRIERGINFYRMALQLNPDYLEARVQLKQLLDRKDRLYKAFQRFPARSSTYSLWLKENSPQPYDLDWMPEIIANLGYKPLISIIVPVYNCPELFLEEMIQSVIDQIYPYWELCLADDASPKPHVKRTLERYAAKDKRIKIIFREENGHISAASNSALELAIGEYISLLDHDDILTPNALYEVALMLNKHPEADMIYSDEDFLNEHGLIESPFFKPDWCPDSFLSKMYTCHLGVYRHSIIKQIGGFRLGYEGSQDYDLVLRFIEKTNKIFHIPKILYHWRIHAESTAGDANAKPYAYKAGVKALSDALNRRGEKGKVIMNQSNPGFYTVRYEITDYKLVSIIIPTRNYGDVLHQCLQSIFDKTTYPNFEVIVIDNGSNEPETLEIISAWQEREPKRFNCYVLDIPFNFSKINNYAVSRANGDYILFLNNDTEVITSDWLEGMVEQVQRNSVGAVGAKLLYPDDTIQHAGVLLGIGDIAGHSHKAFPRDDLGYVGQLATINNYSAVTGACLMCQKKVFEEIGGFDEELVVAYNDVDLCLRMLKQGYNNIYLPHVVLYHHESKSRGYEDTPEKALRHQGEVRKMRAKWGEMLNYDPCYSPNLTNKREDYSIRIGNNLKIQDIPLPEQSKNILLAYAVDSPFSGEQNDVSKLHIKGWVIGRDCSATKIEIIGNGKVMKEIDINLHRKDVAAVYKVKEAEFSGFETYIWLSCIPDKLYLAIQVFLDNNKRIILQEFLITNKYL